MHYNPEHLLALYNMIRNSFTSLHNIMPSCVIFLTSYEPSNIKEYAMLLILTGRSLLEI